MGRSSRLHPWRWKGRPQLPESVLALRAGEKDGGPKRSQTSEGAQGGYTRREEKNRPADRGGADPHELDWAIRRPARKTPGGEGENQKGERRPGCHRPRLGIRSACREWPRRTRSEEKMNSRDHHDEPPGHPRHSRLPAGADVIVLRRISGTSTTRIPDTGFSTAATRAAVICFRVTRPMRRAASRVPGRRSKSQYPGRRKYGQRWPGPRTVPGAQERGVQPLERTGLALGADLAIGLHRGGGLMRHADVHEVLDAPLGGGRGRGGHRREVYADELRSLGRTGVGDSHELEERVGRRNPGGEGVLLQRVADDGFATRRQLHLRARPDQPGDAVPATQECGKTILPRYPSLRPEDLRGALFETTFRKYLGFRAQPATREPASRHCDGQQSPAIAAGENTMTLSLKPKHLKRYKDIAWLLVKYGRADLVSRMEIEDALSPEERSAVSGKETPKAEDLARDLERLGPTYVKLGQLLSTQAELLPLPYVEALARLQDKVEPFSFAEVEEIVSSDLDVRISKAFTDFDATPLAAASLGQVHRATLRDGRAVAVKVQRPAIRERIIEDLEAFAEIADFLDRHTEVGEHFRFGKMLEEFKKNAACASIGLPPGGREPARDRKELGGRSTGSWSPARSPTTRTRRVLTMTYPRDQGHGALRSSG